MCILKMFSMLIMLLLSYISIAGTVESGREAILNLANAARTQNSEDLLEYITKNKIEAPLIYSKWYVESVIAPKNAASAEIEYLKRDFGKKFLQQLSEESIEILKIKDSSARAKRLNALFNLADWIGTQPGYGNALIFYRLQSMATVPLAYLIADTEYPLNNLKTFLGRLKSYPEDKEYNIKILNLEAGTVLFKEWISKDPFPPKTPWEVYDYKAPLNNVWQSNMRKILIWSEKNNEDLPSGEVGRKKVPAELAFFVDDSIDSTKLYTTENIWDGKFHGQFINGLTDRNIRNLRSYLLFREKTGGFPAPLDLSPEAVAKREAYIEECLAKGILLQEPAKKESKLEMAFDFEWERYRVDCGNMDVDAFRCHEKILKNEFYDEDTGNIRKFNEEMERAEKRRFDKLNKEHL